MSDAHASSFRRIAAAIWPRPDQPTIHGVLEVEMSAALAYLDSIRAAGGGRPTVTHLVVRALARALARHPEANARARGGRIRPYPSIDVFVQVAIEGGSDLSGTLVRDADSKGLLEIEREIRERAARIRERKDPLFERTRAVAKLLPAPFLRWALSLSEFLANGVGLHLPSLGIPRRPFGSAMVTSVGMLGVEFGLAPFFPLADSPILLCVGRVHDRPVAIEGRVEVRPVCYVSATLDHRVLDGALIGKMAGVLREYLADPAAHEVPPQPVGGPATKDSPSGADPLPR